MKEVLLSSVAFLGLATGTLAAELPSRTSPAPIAAVPVFTWTGFYVGVQAGYAWGDISAVLRATGTAGAPVSFPFNQGGDYEGFVGGAHVGYNYQIGSFVVGVEADTEGSSLDGDFARANIAATVFVNADSNIDVQGSLRTSLGFTSDRALIYVTGGVAFANFKTDYFYRETTLGGSGSISYDSTEQGGPSVLASNTPLPPTSLLALSAATPRSTAFHIPMTSPRVILLSMLRPSSIQFEQA